MIHVYHGDGKGKTTAAMGLALRMLAAGRRVVVVQFLKDGESGEVRLLAEHFGVPVFAGKASDKFTWSMTSEELAATCELHDGNLASALAELEGAQEGLLVLDEALDALEADHDYLTRDGVFPMPLLETLVKTLRADAQEISRIPHPAEFDRYFDL